MPAESGPAPAGDEPDRAASQRDAAADAGSGSGTASGSGSGQGSGAGEGRAAARSAGGRPARRTGRRFSLTTDTARPEGGGRAAPGDAAAPVRQWPMLSVLAATAIGLSVTALGQPRVGCLIIGVALIGAAVLRRVLPSVGMLAVRSRFTDLVTYGFLGVAITFLALVLEPKPWLEVPFLEDAVRWTVR
ncbi:DUF3017 domain-containing protein [Streptomyces sp. BI20]|uniref:DUF3017 domain-containing protein n=1 Tax=Streptomyces sp. BI20 TaxID=3403460 RepID=UPI003C7400FB